MHPIVMMSWSPSEYITINIQDVLLPKQSQQDTVEPHTLVEEEGGTHDYVDEGGCTTVYVDEGEGGCVMPKPPVLPTTTNGPPSTPGNVVEGGCATLGPSPPPFQWIFIIELLARNKIVSSNKKNKHKIIFSPFIYI